VEFAKSEGGKEISRRSRAMVHTAEYDGRLCKDVGEVFKGEEIW